MTPSVSFVFPAHVEGVPLLLRSVRALLAQTAKPETFEVVIAVDAEESAADAAKLEIDQAIDGLPFAVSVVASPRTAGNENLPHRNHARNAGCRIARGEYLWVLDCDMLPDPRAVEHVRAVTSRSSVPLVVSPCLAEINYKPSAWLERAAPESAAEFDKLIDRHPRSCSGSGHASLYRKGAPNGRRFPKLIEGEPAFPKRIWAALGGYDERYLGYGGNKVSMCRAMTLLDLQEKLCAVYLLTSCLFLHQPHDRDPFRIDEAHRASNWALFRSHVAEMKDRAPWWRAAIDRLQ
jgi:glycosyltransferase involved in cell wall biosynthesis